MLFSTKHSRTEVLSPSTFVRVCGATWRLVSRLTSCRWDRPCSSRLVPSWAECLTQRTCLSSTEVPSSACPKRTWRRLRCRPWRALVFRSRTAGRVSSEPSSAFCSSLTLPARLSDFSCPYAFCWTLFVVTTLGVLDSRIGPNMAHRFSFLSIWWEKESSLLRITWLMSRCQLWDVWRCSLCWRGCGNWWYDWCLWSAHHCVHGCWWQRHTGWSHWFAFVFYRPTLSFERIVSGCGSFRSLDRLSLMIVRSTSLDHVDAQSALFRARTITRRTDSLCVFIISFPVPRLDRADDRVIQRR